MTLLAPRRAAWVFLVFALAYFCSTLIRAITGTLSPVLTQAFGLQARDLGLLAGGYFLGFALTQLPLGHWLDRLGPRRVNLMFLSVAVLGCLAFAHADSFVGLLLARVLTGVGVSACLMAPLTGYRRWFAPDMQLRTNAWMLMTGSLGMLAATLPVQWLVPLWGWRAVFVALALGIAAVMVAMRLVVPPWTAPAAPSPAQAGYGPVWRHRYFWRMAPLGFFAYGGMVAIQTLWAVPWMTQVAGWSGADSAQGFFLINLCMLITFWLWGWITPALSRRGLHANRLIAWGHPWSLLVLGLLLWQGPGLGPWTALALAVFCMACSFVSMAQPAVGMAFDAALAGRALSAFNLVIFSGIFVAQWGMGLCIDAARAAGLSTVDAYRLAFAVYGACSFGAWLFFMAFGRHNPPANSASQAP